jgi:hypothetical protein
MLVTLGVLNSKEAYGDDIQYFQSLEKQEWEVIELMERCFKDKNYYFAAWLFTCVETIEEFKKGLDLAIENKLSLYYAFRYCQELFEKNQELFKKAVEYYVKKGWYLHWVFEYCHKAFAKNQELFKKAVEFHIKKRWSLGFAFRYCNKAFENDPELHKKALEH